MGYSQHEIISSARLDESFVPVVSLKDLQYDLLISLIGLERLRIWLLLLTPTTVSILQTLKKQGEVLYVLSISGSFIA